MLEIEIKAKLNNRERLLCALEREGFVHTRTLEETDIYYNGVDRRFEETDEALRLRCTVDQSTRLRTAALTYKGPKLDRLSRTRVEHEVSLADSLEMDRLLKKLGHTPVMSVKKLRSYYKNSETIKKGVITATVDQVEGLGDYMELETLAEEDAPREEAVEALFEVLKALGIERSACTRYSYLEMMIQKVEVRG